MDALPYWGVRDGVAILHDGTMEVALELTPPGAALAADGDLDALYGSLLAALGHAVPQGERLRVFVEVAPARPEPIDAYQRGLSSPHPAAARLTTAKVDALTRARLGGRLVEHRTVLTCTVTPDRRRRPWTAFTPTEWDAQRARALEVRQRLFTTLDAAGLEPVPLLTQALFELAWRYFNPGARAGSAPALAPPAEHYPSAVLKRFPGLAPPTVRQQLVTSDVARRWDHLWTGGHLLQILTMGSQPVGSTRSGMVQHLLTLGGLHWLVIDLHHEPFGPAVRALMTQARRLHAATGDTGGISDYADPTVRVGFQELDDALARVSETGSHVYRVGLALVLLAPDEDDARRRAREATEAFTHLPGVRPVTESAGLFTQFLALAPLSGRTNERTFLALQENAADLLPLDAPHRGSSRPVSLAWNRWDGLTNIDPFDPACSNWNGIVVGGSGSGKTFLMQTLLGDLLRAGADVVIVDRGYGYQHLVTLFGGTTVPLAPGGGVSLNPFDLPGGARQPDERKQAFLLALLQTMLGSAPDPVETALLSAAVQQTYARASSERRGDGMTVAHHQGARLSDLARVLVTLESVGERPVSKGERDAARHLALTLQPWTGDTPLGQLVDHPTTALPDASVVCFETSGLEAHAGLRNVGLLLIADLVWRRVQRDPARNKVVVLDEAWSLLGVPQAAAFVGELYRRFRRYNAAVYAVTQSLQDFDTPEARGLLQNTAVHYLLRLPGEDHLVQSLLRLPDRAMSTFRSLTGRKGAYSEALAWVRKEDRLDGGVLVVRPTPFEYWAYTTDPNDAPVRDAALARHAGDLVAALDELARTHPHGATGRP